MLVKTSPISTLDISTPKSLPQLDTNFASTTAKTIVKANRNSNTKSIIDNNNFARNYCNSSPKPLKTPLLESNINNDGSLNQQVKVAK